VKTFKLLIILSLLFFSHLSWSATILAIDGTKITIDPEGEALKPGDLFYILNPDSQKKVAVIEIVNANDTRALAKNKRGKPIEGGLLLTIQSKAPMSKHGKHSIGVTIGLSQSKMIFNDVSTSLTLSGSAFDIGVFYNLPWSERVTLRFMGGLENLMVKGTAGAITDAKVNVMYLGLGGFIPVILNPSSTGLKFWIGPGGNLLVPASKSANVVKEENIGVNFTYGLGFGLDILLKNNSYIPVQFEYMMYPDSKSTTTTIKTSAINLRAGFAF
jgi:hypothetical protein